MTPYDQVGKINGAVLVKATYNNKKDIPNFSYQKKSWYPNINFRCKISVADPFLFATAPDPTKNRKISIFFITFFLLNTQKINYHIDIEKIIYNEKQS